MSNPDFYDFGAGKGNSMARASEWWGGTGIGYDATDSRRAVAVGRGYDVREGILPDVMRELPDESARYSVVNHVLEHMPDMNTVREIIKEACRVSREFVYIAGPWFDSDRDLMMSGCKWFCNDWPKDHPTRVTMLDLHSSLSACPDVIGYRMWGRDRIDSTRHKLIYPLWADSQNEPAPYEYNPQKHVRKQMVSLPFCFSEICCVAIVGNDALGCDCMVDFEKHNPNATHILTELR